ncbi:MAG: Fe-S cluster assembly sulfur transfer protein SufU [Gammaproteobacteria bacterium]
MLDLRSLYQEVIIDHNRHPRNFRRMPGAVHVAEGYNPLCGDRLTVYLRMQNGVVADLSFEGEGCAISTASASLMTEHLKGKSEAEARREIERFHTLVTSGERDPAGLGKLEVLAGVREFPVRVKCATLAWHTASAALHGAEEKVTTE